MHHCWFIVQDVFELLMLSVADACSYFNRKRSQVGAVADCPDEEQQMRVWVESVSLHN